MWQSHLFFLNFIVVYFVFFTLVFFVSINGYQNSQSKNHIMNLCPILNMFLLVMMDYFIKKRQYDSTPITRYARFGQRF